MPSDSDFDEGSCLKAIERNFYKYRYSNFGSSKYEKYSEKEDPCLETISKYFGSWTNAKQKVDVNINKRYSEDDCVDAVHRVFNLIDDDSFTMKKYGKAKDEEDPCAELIKDVLDCSWREVREIVQSKELDYSDMISNYTEQECINKLQEASERVEGILECKDYQEVKKEVYPSISCLSRRFGSWNRAKEEAGLRKHHRKNYSREECIESLKTVNELIENDLTLGNYKNNRSSKHPSVSHINTKFGSFSEARKISDIEVSGERYSDEKIICDILEVRDRINSDYLSLSKYRNRKDEDQAGRKAIVKHFGSWYNAKDKADLPTYEEACSGNYINKYGDNWDSIRVDILTKFNYSCVMCGMSNQEHIEEFGSQLDIHHIVKIRSFIDELDDPDDISIDKANSFWNLVSLCKKCHNKMEDKSIDEQIEKYNKYDYNSKEIRFLVNWSRLF